MRGNCSGDLARQALDVMKGRRSRQERRAGAPLSDQSGEVDSSENEEDEGNLEASPESEQENSTWVESVGDGDGSSSDDTSFDRSSQARFENVRNRRAEETGHGRNQNAGESDYSAAACAARPDALQGNRQQQRKGVHESQVRELAGESSATPATRGRTGRIANITNVGRGWREVTVGQAAHRATPRKAFIGVAPVRGPTTLSVRQLAGMRAPGSAAPAAACQMPARGLPTVSNVRSQCRVAPVSRGARAPQQSEEVHHEVGHSVWEGGVRRRPGRVAEAKGSGHAGVKPAGGRSAGIGLEQLFQDCDAFLRARNISSAAATAKTAVAAADAQQHRLESAVSGAEVGSRSESVLQECDGLKKKLTISQSLTGMLWMTMRFADSLKGAAAGAQPAVLNSNGCLAEPSCAADSRPLTPQGRELATVRSLDSTECRNEAVETGAPTAKARNMVHAVSISEIGEETEAVKADDREEVQVEHDDTEHVVAQTVASSSLAEEPVEDGVTESADGATESEEDGSAAGSGTSVTGEPEMEKRAEGIERGFGSENRKGREDAGTDGTSDDADDANDYEAERAARIQRNRDAMAELGLARKPPPPAPKAPAAARRRRTTAETIGSEDSSRSEYDSEWDRQQETSEESSRWETETSESSEDDAGGDRRRARGRGEAGSVKADHGAFGKGAGLGAKMEQPRLKVPLLCKSTSLGNVPRGGRRAKEGGKASQKQRLRALRVHPSSVNPLETGLSRMEQFRAEMVRAVYESEGTSAAEELMGSSLPSIVHRSFAEVGWGKVDVGGEVRARGGEGRCGESGDGGSKVVANKALSDHTYDDSELEDSSPSCTPITSAAAPSPARGREIHRGQSYELPLGHERASSAVSPQDSALTPSSPSSSTCSSLRKRLLECEVGGRHATSDGATRTADEVHRRPHKIARSSSSEYLADDSEEGRQERRGVARTRPRARALQGRKSWNNPAPLAPGEWCRRDGVKGKYYQTQGKYLCNNCGAAGHVKSTCPHPVGLMDRALEALGWQVLAVARKGGVYEEKFFVPPDRSVQLRGIRKLGNFVRQEMGTTLACLVLEQGNGSGTEHRGSSGGVNACAGGADMPSSLPSSSSPSGAAKRQEAASDSSTGTEEPESSRDEDVDAEGAQQRSQADAVGLRQGGGGGGGGGLGRPGIRLPPQSALLKAASVC